jgi:hypothetical protein
MLGSSTGSVFLLASRKPKALEALALTSIQFPDTLNYLRILRSRCKASAIPDRSTEKPTPIEANPQ